MKRALVGVVIGALALAACSSATPSRITSQARTVGCKGYVALTIDDGPTDSTGLMLTILRIHHATATFFDVGAKVQKYPDVTLEQAAVGELGNHTYSHPFIDRLPKNKAYRELLGTSQIIKSLTGTTPVLFRPPFDRVNPDTDGIARSLGMVTVLWNIDTRDYVKGTDVVKSFTAAKAGDIILIHDGIPDTVKSLSHALDQLEAHHLCTGKVVPSTTPHYAWNTESFGDVTFFAKVVAPASIS